MGLGVAPVHSLPWYFGVVALGIWAAAAFCFALLLRRRLKVRAEGRRTLRASRRDDQALGTGTEVEPRR